MLEGWSSVSSLKAARGVGRAPVDCCFLAGPLVGAGLALEELVDFMSSAVLLVAFFASESELWRVVLLSAEEAGVIESFASLLPSEDESDEESSELESDSGSGVLVAVLRAFLSSFLVVPFSDSDEESEEELESDEDELSSLEESDSDSEESLLSLSEESESDDDESDSDEDFSAMEDTFGFFVMATFFSDSESDSELDSALRFKPPADLGAGAGAGAFSSSSSSSASLSELEEVEEDDELEEEDDPEGFFFCVFGASLISTSESLASSELLSLSSLLELPELLDELGLADRFTFVSFFWPSHVLKSSSNEGTFAGSFDWLVAFPACSLARAALVLE